MTMLTTTDTLQEIQKLLSLDDVDKKRIKYIISTLKEKKNLYNSDKKYLEEKLHAKIIKRDNGYVLTNLKHVKPSNTLESSTTYRAELIPHKTSQSTQAESNLQNKLDNNSVKVVDEIKIQKIENEKQILKLMKTQNTSLEKILQKQEEMERRPQIEKRNIDEQIRALRSEFEWMKMQHSEQEKTHREDESKRNEDLEKRNSDDQIVQLRSELVHNISKREDVERSNELEKDLLEEQINMLHTELETIHQNQIAVQRKMRLEKERLEKQIKEQQSNLEQFVQKHEEIDLETIHQNEIVAQRKIRLEKERLDKQIKEQQSNLERLAQRHEEIETKANQEKSKLEEKIALERKKTEEEFTLVGQIVQQRKELEEIIHKKDYTIKKLQREQQEYAEKIKQQKQTLSELEQTKLSENNEK